MSEVNVHAEHSNKEIAYHADIYGCGCE